jgi:hypothetical protein
MAGLCLFTGTYEILFAYLETAVSNIQVHSKQVTPLYGQGGTDLQREARSTVITRFSMTLSCTVKTRVMFWFWSGSGIARLRFFHAFSSVVSQMPGYNSQRRGTVRTLPN